MSALLQNQSTPHMQANLATVGFYGALGVVGLAGVALLIIGANPLLVLVPMVLVTAAAVLVALPLRWSVSGLLLLMLALDETQETKGSWVSPLAVVGDLFHYRIDSTLPLPGVSFSGMEVMIVAILAIHAFRIAKGSRIDQSGQVEPASVIRDLIILYVAGVVLAEAVGLFRGVPVAPYKLRNLLHPILLMVVFVAAYRGPGDARALGRIFVFAACVKGVIAHIVQAVARNETGGMFRSAMSHGDSMIFAAAGTLIVFRYLENPQRRLILPGIAMLGLIFLGCIENNRRIVWVIFWFSFLFAYLIRPFSGWQRKVTRLLLLAIPAVLIYVAAGWNSGSKIFSPVRTLRGVSDTSHDTSAYWREVETWNIAVSMRETFLIGKGLGGEYTEYMPNDAISYEEYREWPHNTVIGLLMLMGLLGFTAQWVFLPCVLLLAVRSYWMARSVDERLLALACTSAIISCFVMSWGDTGAHFPQYKILAALATVFAAKLAVATGAWKRSPRPSVQE